MFIIGRAVSIAGKEVRHILRDPFTLALALGLPVILVTFFGFAIDFNVSGISMAVYDSDKSRLSRQFAEIFSDSGYFKVLRPLEGSSVLRELNSERASAALVIKPRFADKLAGGKSAEAQFILDGADNSRAGAVLGYLPGILKSAHKRLSGISPPESVELRTRFLYNHELNSRWFIIPGLTVIVLGLMAIFLTALTVAREWENGSMELLLSTPVMPMEIILGKIMPYLGLGIISVIFVYFTARAGFGVPFRGSHILFAVSCLMFLTAALSQGLLISVVTRQQQLAMQFSMLMGLLPSLLLSGFVFPIESMPLFFQYLTAVLPPRWFMLICRGIFLKGAGITELAGPLFALLLMDVILITAAAKKFKRDLEP